MGRAGRDGFATLLRDLRRQALLTQKDLAERSGVSVGTIAGLENGRTRPRADSLRLLAAALNLGSAQRAEVLAAAGLGPAPSASPRPDTTLVPRQLPRDPGFFAGRADELQRLDQILDGAGPAAIVSIFGTAGVGKTTLALRWAYRVADRFPDGQLYLDLHGFGHVGVPVDPAQAIRLLLEGLSATGRALPDSYEAQLGLYRSLTAGRRLLLMLDNARDSDQIRPLLPGSPGSLTVVTSRGQLSAVVAQEGAYPLMLNVLSEPEARELLAVRLGRARMDAEPEAVDVIVDACARLPLALAVAAARTAADPATPLATLAAQLGDARSRLDALDGGETTDDLRAVMSWSYEALTAPAARLFRLAGALFTTDFSERAAASAAGLPLPAARRLLAELIRANLLTARADGWYAIHDLLRSLASERLAAEAEADRAPAAQRLMDYRLQSAHAANRLIEYCLNPIVPVSPVDGVTPEEFADRPQGTAWLSASRTTLVAAVTSAREAGLLEHCWQLAWSLKTFLEWRGYLGDCVELLEIGLAATGELGDLPAQARLCRAVGRSLAVSGGFRRALECSHRAVELFEAAGDVGGRARTLHDVAFYLLQMGRREEAMGYADRAMALYRQADQPTGVAGVLNIMAWENAKDGVCDLALVQCDEALALLERHGDTRGWGITIDTKGYAYHQRGDYADAIDCYQRSVRALGPDGDRRVLAEIYQRLGEAMRSDGDPVGARYAFGQAQRMLDDLQEAGAE